mgnify:CR=1 FL=1
MNNVIRLRSNKVAKLDDEVRECKQVWLGINEYLNVTKLKETMKEEKLETRRQNVNEMKNVCTTKSWVDVCTS